MKKLLYVFLLIAFIITSFSLHAEASTFKCRTCSDDPGVCQRCNGARSEVCMTCRGTFGVKCGTCKGSGKIICNTQGNIPGYMAVCDGGKLKCVFCHATGKFANGESLCPYCGGAFPIPCSTCHGTGLKECYSCKGLGYYPCTACGGTGIMSCLDCKGSGRCMYCNGKGYITVDNQDSNDANATTILDDTVGNTTKYNDKNTVDSAVINETNPTEKPDSEGAKVIDSSGDLTDKIDLMEIEAKTNASLSRTKDMTHRLLLVATVIGLFALVLLIFVVINKSNRKPFKAIAITFTVALLATIGLIAFTFYKENNEFYNIKHEVYLLARELEEGCINYRNEIADKESEILQAENNYKRTGRKTDLEKYQDLQSEYSVITQAEKDYYDKYLQLVDYYNKLNSK